MVDTLRPFSQSEKGASKAAERPPLRGWRGLNLRSDKETGRPERSGLFPGPSEGIRPALWRRPPWVAKRPRRFAKSPRVRIPQIQFKTPTSPKGDIGVLVRVKGFEPPASWSQTTRATNCATPGRQKKAAAAFPGCEARAGFFGRQYYTTGPPQTQEENAPVGILHLFHLTAEENCGILSEELFSGRFHFPDGSETVFCFHIDPRSEIT